MSDEKLKQVLNFDESDIGANRLGQLTQKQKTLLGEKFKSNKMLYTGIGVILFLMICSVVFRIVSGPLMGIVTEDGQSISDSLSTVIPILVVGLIMALFFGFILFLIIRVVFQKANRQADMAVRRAEGKVNFVWVEREERNLSKTGPMFKKIRSLEMRVGEDTNFKGVNSELPNLINQGEEWIVYYVNHPFKILSAEKAK